MRMQITYHVTRDNVFRAIRQYLKERYGISNQKMNLDEVCISVSTGTRLDMVRVTIDEELPERP